MDKLDFNRQIWDAVSRPPHNYLKKISAGRIAGMTDVNPEWRIMAMTDVFGPVGIGWKYTLDRLWTEPGTDGQVFVFVTVSVYIKIGDTWSDPIPGIGGHFLIQKEKNGLHNNDEGFKMATTDALSVALKAIGVAAEIYLGNWDGSKYKTAPPEQPPPEQPAAAKPNDFGRPATPPSNQPPKPPASSFIWGKATSAQRLAYTVQKLAEAESMPAADAMAKFKSIAEWLASKGSDFSEEDRTKLTDILLASEDVIKGKV